MTAAAQRFGSLTARRTQPIRSDRRGRPRSGNINFAVANPITRVVLPPGAPCDGVEESAMSQFSECRKRSAPKFCAEAMEPRMMLAASMVQDLNTSPANTALSMLGHVGNVAI